MLKDPTVRSSKWKSEISWEIVTIAVVVSQPNSYPVGKGKVFAHGVKVVILEVPSILHSENRVSSQQGIKGRSDDMYLLETDGYRRVRRDTEAAFDPKCNSEALKDIILKVFAYVSSFVGSF